MNAEGTGKYLNRSVILECADVLSELEYNNVSCSVILLWLGNPAWNAEDLQVAIKNYVLGNVLSLTIAGQRTDESFQMMLENLSVLQRDKHIMTGVIDTCDVDEAVDQFLIATWPDEGRFAAWIDYRIVVVGDSNLTEEIRQAIHRVMNRETRMQLDP